MAGFSESARAVKKLGELLVEAGFLTEVQLEKSMDVSKKNFQSLGKVLVSTKTCSQNDVNNALEIQKYCKMEGLSGELAVRALQQIKAHYLSPQIALERIGWITATYNPHQEPEDIVAAKKALKDAEEGLPQGQALELIADAFVTNKLPARAEMKYQEALQIYEQLMPDSAPALCAVLSKMSRLAASQNRLEDAKQLLVMAQSTLEEEGLKNSKEAAMLKHLSAEFLVGQRNFAAAEQQLLDSFALLEGICPLNDQIVLDTVRKYVELVNKGKKGPTPGASRAPAPARWREMSHESQPDKVTLGELLKGSRLVDERDLTSAWQYSKDTKVALGRAFVDLKVISEKQLQLTLKTQLLVRNGEITAQLGVWLLLYAVQLGFELEEVLELFNCAPQTQRPLADELRAAAEKMEELEAYLPPSHQDLGFAHAKQARFFFYRQQYTEADNHYKRAVEILLENPEVEPESLIELLDNYAQVKQAMEDTAETVSLSKLAVQIRSKYYGKDSVPYAKGVERLAQAFCGAGDHHTAVSMFNRALTVRERFYGTDDRELVPCLELKAACQVHAENYAEAETLYERCLQISARDLGNQHATTERIKKKLAAVYAELGKQDKAKALLPTQIRKNTLQLRRE